eukprot:3938357-Rhodomonas_salina.5
MSGHGSHASSPMSTLKLSRAQGAHSPASLENPSMQIQSLSCEDHTYDVEFPGHARSCPSPLHQLPEGQRVHSPLNSNIPGPQLQNSGAPPSLQTHSGYCPCALSHLQALAMLTPPVLTPTVPSGHAVGVALLAAQNDPSGHTVHCCAEP